MRRTIILAALLSSTETTTSAFSLSSKSHQNNNRHTALSAKPASPAEILARVNQNAGIPEEELLFEEPLLDDMQQILLTLEKRVKEGPGSIGLLEIEQFQAMANNILAEMKDKENERLNDLASAPAAPPAQQLAAAAVEAPAPAVEAAIATPSEDADVEKKEVADTSEDDGPAYDGSGGMGLAKGTANTWIIEGMDSMSPEEYQAAIQASVSARQAKRKETGVYGNRWTNDYLNNLSGNTEGGGMLKNNLSGKSKGGV